MHRRSLATLVLAAAFVVGCDNNPVGRICDLGTTTPQTSEKVIASPSLDCVSRTCLKVPLEKTLPANEVYPSGNSGLCTAECSSDSDCQRVPESPCSTGFTCGIVVDVGPFCCEKFCICKDYIQIPSSGHLDPDPACDPTVPANLKCCNLPGSTAACDLQ